MDPEAYFERSRFYKESVEFELKRLFAVKGREIYPPLAEAMYYSLEAGGKRIRPCLMLAVCEFGGGDVLSALPFACALEMIHTYSLIHDDMPGMDNDALRRGRPSNHVVFGEGMALLAGDALLSFAMEVMTDAVKNSRSPGALEAMSEIARLSGASGMLTGQAADKVNENNAKASEGLLGFIHRHKTADMLEAAVISGALIAGADADTIGILRKYSSDLGLLFQITDDILDVVGEETSVGKTLGKDLNEGKITYVSLLGLDGARLEAKRIADRAKKTVAGLPCGEYLSAAAENVLTRDR